MRWTKWYYQSFESPEEVIEMYDKYKQYTIDNDLPIHIYWFAEFCDVCVDTINVYWSWDYDKEEQQLKYSSAIKKVKDNIVADKLNRLEKGKGSTVWIIFSLKNSHWWADRNDNNINVSGNLSISKILDDIVK